MTPAEQLQAIEVDFHLDYAFVGPGHDRRRVEYPDRITDVQIRLSDAEWCSLCMRDREMYLGGCCGQLGHFQSQLNALFRDSGWINTSDLAEVVLNVESHDGFECFEREPGDLIERALKHYEALDPIEKIGAIWNIVKPAVYMRGTADRGIPTGAVPPGHQENPIEWDIMVLERSLLSRGWRQLFRDPDNPQQKREPYIEEQKHTDDLLLDSKILIRLRRVYEYFQSLGHEPFSGFAILDENGDVCTNGYGDCVYRTEASAKTMLDIWKAKRDEEGAAFLSTYRIVPCHVSLEEGLTL